jgi:hypothetical protein
MTEEAKPGEALPRKEILAAVEEIVARPNTDHNDDEVVLSTGVVIEVVRPISISQLMDIDAKFADPPVPKVYIKDQDREVDNPGSPIYQAAVKANTAKKAFAVLDAVTMMCTRIKSVPEDMFGPDDDEWAEMLEEMGYSPKTSKGRYVLWLRLYAGPAPTDMNVVTNAALRKMGVREEDVLAALDNFQDNGAGPADLPGKDQG